MSDVFCIVNRAIKLSDPTGKIQLQQPLAYNNAYAHSMRVTVYNDDGSDMDLAGVGVVASFMKANNDTVDPINGTTSGNVAEVLLPPSCYVTPGRFKFTMNLSKATDATGIETFSPSEPYAKGDLVVYNGVVYRFTEAHSAGAWTGEDVALDGSMRTVLWVEGMVERNVGGTIIDPGTPVGNIEQAIGQAMAAASSATEAATAATDAAEEATDAAESVDDIVLVQTVQPVSEHNKIWIQPQSDEYKVPTWEEYSDLKSALVASTGNGTVNISTSGYLRCATSPVDFTNVGVSADYKYTVINVTAGDKFRITGGSIGAAARLYCFTDDNGVIKGNADANITVTDMLLTAPEGSTKLIINNALLAETPVAVTYGDWLVNDVRQTSIETKAIADATVVLVSDKTPVSLNNNEGYLLNTDGSVTDYQTGWWVTNQTDISEFESLIVSARSGYNHLLYAFYNSSGTFIPGSGENSGSDMKTIVDKAVAIPSNAKYIRISGVYPDQTPGLIGVSNIRYENNANLEKWNNKTWVVIGDSLTDKNNTALIKYYDYVSDDTGITINVQAHSGTGYANPGNTDNFLTRAQSVPVDADVYTIFGSFNDYEYSVTNSIPIGTASDTGTSTLCGYFNSTISALISRNPLINIGIVSPCPWVSVNEYNGAGNGFGKQYSDALKAVAERWSIPFLNLYECSGLRPWNADFVAEAYTKDSLMGVHPDETGHKILSTKFKEFLEMLLA